MMRGKSLPSELILEIINTDIRFGPKLNQNQNVSFGDRFSVHFGLGETTVQLLITDRKSSRSVIIFSANLTKF